MLDSCENLEISDGKTELDDELFEYHARSGPTLVVQPDNGQNKYRFLLNSKHL